MENSPVKSLEPHLQLSNSSRALEAVLHDFSWTLVPQQAKYLLAAANCGAADRIPIRVVQRRNIPFATLMIRKPKVFCDVLLVGHVPGICTY